MVLDLSDSEQICCFLLNEFVVDLVRVVLHDYADELASVLGSEIDEIIHIDVMESSSPPENEEHRGQ